MDEAPNTEVPSPPLQDPWVGVPPPPPRAARGKRASPWAIAGFASGLLLGPVGAMLAVIFGVVGRNDAEGPADQAASARRWSNAAIAFGSLLLCGWGALGSFLVWTRLAQDREPAFDPVAAPAPPARHPREPTARPPAPTAPSMGSATRVEREGTITVVDLGQDSPSLAEALGHQRAAAVSAKETLVLMTTSEGCAPCQGVDASLADARLQTALAKVRLVRVDIRMFHDDLEDLRIPDDRIPGFFLLSSDFTPRDGVDGGEWDEDVAANIAPVLGDFVRGRYKKRREAWHPLPGSGVTL